MQILNHYLVYRLVKIIVSDLVKNKHYLLVIVHKFGISSIIYDTNNTLLPGINFFRKNMSTERVYWFIKWLFIYYFHSDLKYLQENIIYKLRKT